MEVINDKLRLFSDDEYQLEDPELSALYVTGEKEVGNILNTYCREINKYKLLSSADEVNYGLMLKNSRGNPLIVFRHGGKRDIPSLNTSRLFHLLCNSSLYKDVIDNLLLFYDRLHTDSDKAIDELIKYRNETRKVNRALNESELSNLFNIDCSKDTNTLTDCDLLKEVKDFMNYKFAFTKFFVSNLKLVVDRVMQIYYAKKGIDIMDLISEGNVGLIRAINGFDISMGNKFSTYATPCIETFVKNYMDSNTSVKFPMDMVRNMRVFRGKVSRLEQEEKRVLDAEEIAEKLNMPLETVKEYLRYSMDSISFDQPLASDDSDELSLKDVIAGDTTTEDIVMDNHAEENTEFLYTLLTSKEKEVILMSFGLGKYRGNKYSNCEISNNLGVSKQRIAQLKAMALIKMKTFAKTYVRKGYI